MTLEKKKMHLSKDGKARKCEATTEPCKLMVADGVESPHAYFDNEKDAQVWAEEQNAKIFGSGLGSVKREESSGETTYGEYGKNLRGQDFMPSYIRRFQKLEDLGYRPEALESGKAYAIEGEFRGERVVVASKRDPFKGTMRLSFGDPYEARVIVGSENSGALTPQNSAALALGELIENIERLGGPEEHSRDQVTGLKVIEVD